MCVRAKRDDSGFTASGKTLHKQYVLKGHDFPACEELIRSHDKRQGTTSVVPNKRTNQVGLYRLRKNSIKAPFTAPF
jgi:hypothetical protein